MSPMAEDFLRRTAFNFHTVGEMSLKELGAILRCLKEIREGRINE